MSPTEELRADFSGLGLTTEEHPMAALRPRLPDVVPARNLKDTLNGLRVTIAGSVICRQRPGTAKGFVFISLEDETGVSNAIVTPQLFEKQRLLITQEDFLVIEGQVQNTDNVVLVKTKKVEPLPHGQLAGSDSHDFH